MVETSLHTLVTCEYSADPYEENQKRTGTVVLLRKHKYYQWSGRMGPRRYIQEYCSPMPPHPSASTFKETFHDTYVLASISGDCQLLQRFFIDDQARLEYFLLRREQIVSCRFVQENSPNRA